MRALFVLVVLLLVSSVARAEEWAVLRESPETGESAAARILVDKSSIEVPGSGMRRAKVKVDFSGFISL